MVGALPVILVRSVSGLGYAEQGINGTYLSELYVASDDPRVVRRRGFLYAFVQGGWPFGALLAAALTAILLPRNRLAGMLPSRRPAVPGNCDSGAPAAGKPAIRRHAGDAPAAPRR